MRTKRCKHCNKMIRDWNKNGYCCSCASNKTRRDIKLKMCHICEEPCSGKLLIEYRKNITIGYITTWSKKKEINEELKFEIYEFGDQFDEDNPHNRPAITNGYKEVNLVLDGQQRLTALLIGLKGTYSYSHYNVKKVNKLYINLFSDIEDSEENVEGLKYEIKFFVNPPVEEGSFWLEIGKVLDFAKDGAEDFKASYHNNIIEKSKKDSILEKRAMKILGETISLLNTSNSSTAQKNINKTKTPVLQVKSTAQQ